MVKWPQVYYFDIVDNTVERIRDFPDAFGVPRTQQITAAHR